MTFTPDPRTERIRQVLATGSDIERVELDRALRGQQRVALALYEERLRDHLSAGGALPDGVRPL